MSKTRKLALCGVLAAIYFALSFLTVQTGSLKFTMTSLSLVIAALLLGLPEACAVALVGEGLYQLLLYPLSVTTPLWLLPPVLHAAALWLFARLLCRTVQPEQSVVRCALVCLLAAVINSAANTAALFVDSKVFGYYQPQLVFGMAGVRCLVGLATAAVVAAVSIPLLRLLRKRLTGGAA